MAIKKCIPCKPHPYQDGKYGPQMRVWTTGASHICTVCGQKVKVETKK